MKPAWMLALLVPVFAQAGWSANFEEITAAQLPSLSPDGDLALYTSALERQIENCEQFASGGHYTHCSSEPNPAAAAVACDIPVLQKLRELSLSSKDWKSFYTSAKSSFRWFRYKPTSVLFTGYNVPLFEGTLEPDARHKVPIYSRPADLVSVNGADGTTLWKKRLADATLTAYDDRRAIDVNGSLAGKGLEVAYMEFPSDALRLHIEGSGVFEVRQPGGGVKRYGMNFAGKNGLPFVSVFKHLRDKGVDQKYMTFPGLKQYFLDFPDDVLPTLVTDPAYAFFSLSEEEPCGAAKVNLTPGHSLAVDPTHVPLGVAAFFSATRPKEGGQPGNMPFTRFAVAEDTGGAILGGHVDVYWGTGDYAELASNSMSGQGTLYIMKLPALRSGR
jgi:membrane-bound lytic murein transglycosylase